MRLGVGEDEDDGGNGGVELGLEVPFAFFAILVHIVAGHLLEQWAEKSKHVVLLSEGAIAIGMGAAAGALLRYGVVEEVTEFGPEVFWYAVLPPIILQQASGLKKAAFFQNLFPILVYGVLGTLLTFALLTVSAFYLSRLPWVVTAGCSEGLLDFRKGKEGARREEEEEGTACFQDFSLIKSLLLAAILSASDGVAALKHIQPHHPPPTLQPHHPPPTLQPHHPEAGQTSTADHQHEGLAVAPYPPHSFPSPAPSPPSSSSSRLGALILGENVLNEALSILLFKTALDDYRQPDKGAVDRLTGLRALVLLATAVLIGLLVGLACSRLLYRQPSFRHDPLRQVALLLMCNYLAYGIAESLGLSGTLTLLFCSLTLSHYAPRNLAPAAQAGAAVTFELMSMLAEAFSFVYIGLTLAGLRGRYSLRFSFLLFLALAGIRLLGVFLLTPLLRLWDPRLVLPFREQLAFAVAGMVRGNVCWAQALQVGSTDQEIASTVLVVVLLGLAVFEVLLPLLVRLLGLRGGAGVVRGEEGAEEVLLVEDWAEEEGGDRPGARVQSQPPARAPPSASVAERWNAWVGAAFARLDEGYLQPFFSGPPAGAGTGETGGEEREEKGPCEPREKDRCRPSSGMGASSLEEGPCYPEVGNRPRHRSRKGEQERARLVYGNYEAIQGEDPVGCPAAAGDGASHDGDIEGEWEGRLRRARGPGCEVGGTGSDDSA
ncbi:hypothetical protein NSK_005943 [Nannochloropsis salina CCMP1776]|uniref:Cation/H+ exchanger transmembrane domain-containing protein n=1 Tax=Nannochloropsis salina CCMP1776 TaxID=1027361 RepID=A0A4D9CU76_9STRA|nr:hypothetical protein NSK_005943 [Nannochloropsis salina CCMP1776]|eukprot:TFJ82750.1 hypothetical protein NSK_005943 [Nannochloropsis salina CCMP1776]